MPKNEIPCLDSWCNTTFFLSLSFISHEKVGGGKKENTSNDLNKWPTNGYHSWRTYNKWRGERGEGEGEGECHNAILPSSPN